MKYIYRSILLVGFLLVGCSSNKAPTSQSATDVSQTQVDSVLKKIQVCLSEVNQTEDAKYVDQKIIALLPNNPNAKTLFNSSDKISSEQAVILTRFQESTLRCQVIAKELPSPDLVAVYSNYYEKIGDVYKDLIGQKITIGVANQERAMRIQYARSRWAQIMKEHKVAN
ncbi:MULTISPECIES: hypothetical protein [Polynucleobacter]|jgi:hypothetical protein|uniref:Lysozyme inhibitor LprI N-terminal domain-containing protein n=1 Tax=Polynucleobacter asymbioticus (strain DSM 18221 / CIP 109841 / QLW-P1DMWA-1) TaxID=312153 RepID=A4SWY9_POLAQ|nr:MULTISPECIES: hypothetical protein [Polynucleobacter]ABP34003.1 hypothetical protein Pnuc_0785 [Polynucleobacter asymbioticus QLW-P1DMWA-1]APC05864.1 hypothetical protein AOC10_04580 [Polynucleobacter asymbioticus]MBU3577408.1 hypothetical protein [Polynucleobacter sp. UK-Kesae-W10]